MPYVTPDGQMVARKPFGPALIADYFWGVVNFVNCFFRGLFHMDDAGPQRGAYGNNAGRQRIPGGRSVARPRNIGGVAPPPCGMGGG